MIQSKHSSVFFNLYPGSQCSCVKVTNGHEYLGNWSSAEQATEKFMTTCWKGSLQTCFKKMFFLNKILFVKAETAGITLAVAARLQLRST